MRSEQEIRSKLKDLCIKILDNEDYIKNFTYEKYKENNKGIGIQTSNYFDFLSRMQRHLEEEIRKVEWLLWCLDDIKDIGNISKGINNYSIIRDYICQFIDEYKELCLEK